MYANDDRVLLALLHELSVMNIPSVVMGRVGMLRIERSRGAASTPWPKLSQWCIRLMGDWLLLVCGMQVAGDLHFADLEACWVNNFYQEALGLFDIPQKAGITGALSYSAIGLIGLMVLRV